MKELQEQFKMRGFDYKLEFKTLSGYVYSQAFKGRVLAYEAFLRKENTQFNCVSFPGDNAFGVWAWSCKSLEGAKRYIL